MTQRSAVLSECGNFRYQLVRALDRDEFKTSTLPGYIGWVLNNPSTADHEVDDATVRKCWRYTTLWGYGGMMFVNTNPYRSTDPKRAKVPEEQILLANDSWLAYAMGQCPYMIAAWGDGANPELARRAVAVMHRLGPLHAMGITQSGNPRHPLYLPGNLQPSIWKPKGLN
jgi:hypothetical protein